MLKELTSLSGYDFGSSLEQGSSHEKLHALRQTMAEVPVRVKFHTSSSAPEDSKRRHPVDGACFLLTMFRTFIPYSCFCPARSERWFFQE